MGEPALNLDTPIGGVAPEYVLSVWPKVEPILKRVIKPDSGYAPHHVLMEIQQRIAQLWIIGDFDAAVITKILVKPLHKVLFIPFMAGNGYEVWRDDWQALMEAYAIHNGCSAIEWSGRRGWKRLADSHGDGYKPMLITIRKELENGL